MRPLLLAALLAASLGASADPVLTEVRRTDDGWQLYRAGAPYLIRGAGGDADLALLAAAGGNSLRTWGADDLDARLDAAHAQGLSVAVGIWLGHERHGFDYGDPAQVQAQFEIARQVVLKYRDHPAVLLWGIGNEMEGFEAGDNPAIWKAVNAIAAMAKELDPHHPTMTVTAEIGGERVASINRWCQAIDIHGINAYGGGPSLLERYRKAGGVKPIVLTEFGPPGAWEVGKNAWGAPLEPTSTRKAQHYREAYERVVTDGAGLTLGSYAFTWGFKMEATATWFGMFLSNGARLAAVDTMTELWTGKPPADRAPVIEPLTVDGEGRVDPGEELRVRATVSDPEGGPVELRW
ncbi:MAG: glycoside hydrolase family 2 TIM barrel-domain containing protein, partial [Pseudomonadota bacterium]